jgi:heme-degrading monooxygenase HmoA
MDAKTRLLTLPEPPYFAVIFTSKLSLDDEGYDEMARRMEELAAEQDGFLGIESARGADGVGITVSYWRDEASIRAWKGQSEHRGAQATGQARWYEDFTVRVASVERAYGGDVGF